MQRRRNEPQGVFIQIAERFLERVKNLDQGVRLVIVNGAFLHLRFSSVCRTMEEPVS